MLLLLVVIVVNHQTQRQVIQGKIHQEVEVVFQMVKILICSIPNDAISMMEEDY